MAATQTCAWGADGAYAHPEPGAHLDSCTDPGCRWIEWDCTGPIRTSAMAHMTLRSSTTGSPPAQ